jgi:cardiolipin synthase A/B
VYASNVAHRLERVAHHDWKHSHPLDLTDEGLLAEMEEHNMDAGNELALNAKGKKKRG